MRTRRSAFLALVAASSSRTSAPRRPISAARRAVASRTTVASYARLQFSWTGLYIGAHVGYGWSDVDWQFAATPGVSTSHSGGGGAGRRPDRLQHPDQAVSCSASRPTSRARGIDGSTACPGAGFNCGHSFNWMASAARPRRHRRQRQPHAALRHGGRRLGRRRLRRQGCRHRRHLRHRLLQHAMSAGSPAAASSTCSRRTSPRGSNISTTASTR